MAITRIDHDGDGVHDGVYNGDRDDGVHDGDRDDGVHDGDEGLLKCI